MKAEYFDEKVGWTKTLLIGFQHVLTMCPGTIAVPLILRSESTRLNSSHSSRSRMPSSA